MGREYIFLRNGSYSRSAAMTEAAKKKNGAAKSPAFLAESYKGKPEPVGAIQAIKAAELSENELAYLRKSKPSIPEKTFKNYYLDLYTAKDHVSMTIRKMPRG
jgi:hypothetical protein